jgi:phosphonate transport system substrate-binding protein
MARQINILAGLFAALIVGAASVGAPRAQDCPRGDLDKAYCDRDGDFVADAPADPKQLVNPSTLIFAYTPVEDPAVYAKAWDGFVKYMEQTTGKKVVFFPVQSNAAEIEAMRSGRLHVAGFNTGSNPIAVNCAGFVPFAMMGTKDGQFGYEMAGRSQGQEGGIHLAHLELRIQGAVGDLEGGLQPRGQSGFHPGVLRQARQLRDRRRQQGL